MAGYEELRSQVLGNSDSFRRSQGWALFLGKGMAAWMEAWKEFPGLVATSFPRP
ncbi:MAG: hypothetical protein GTO40_02070, partial [Deltaproteobacteria bacterium]|nr:hypothetical protein [Deltaproteobacteria bacterium]